MSTPTGAQNIVSLGFNVEEIKAQKKEVESLFVDLFGKLEQYDGTKFNPLGGGGLGDLRKSINDGAKAMGEIQALAAKYNETITEQARRLRDLAKANEEFANSTKKKGGGDQPTGNSPSPAGGGGTRGPKAPPTADSEAIKLQEQLAATQAKVGVASSETAKQLAQERLILQQLNAENKTAAKEALGLVSAYDRLDAEFKAAFKSATEIGIALGTNSEEYKKAAAAANELNDRLKELDEDGGKFGRHVGNYKGAFQDAFNALKEQLASVKAEMSGIEEQGKAKVNDLTGGNPIGFDPSRHKGDVTNFTKAGGGSVNISAGDAGNYQELSNKAKILEENLGRVTIGFKTSRQEARAFQEAATQVGLAFGDTSEEFLTFNKAVGQGQNAINDLKAATKFQASDAKFITGLADAASTLAGAFGAAQAASALFAGDNEHLQEQLAKFQQLLVLINGLQAFANGLQAEAGGMQLLLSVRTQLVNAAKATQQLITAKSIQIMVAETAATSADAVATEALAGAKVEATVAEEAQTAASIENTEAITANAAANTAAAGATKSLSTTFIAGGIAALAIGAGVALALLTAKLIGYGETAGLTIKQQEQLADAMKDANAIIVEQSEFIKALDSATKNYYQNQLALSQAAGLNQYKQFALQQQIAAAEKESAQQQIDALGATNRQQAELASTIQLLNDRRLEAIRIEQALLAIPDKDRTGSQDDQLKAAQANVEFYQKQIDSVRGLYDAGQKARQDLFASIQKQGQLELQQQKFTADEQRKLTLETTKLEIDAQKDRNSKILGDARSTLGQRLAAIRSNRDLEKKEADAELASARSQYKAGLITPVELETAERQANAARTRADRDYLVQKRQEERAAYERDRDAALEVYKSEKEKELLVDQDILSRQIGTEDGQVTGDQKVIALKNQLEVQRDLVEKDRVRDLDALGLDEEQKKAINAKYDKEIYDLNFGYLNASKKLEDEIRDSTLAEWDKFYEARKLQLDTETNAELDALNDRLNKRKITEEKYADDRSVIESENLVKSLELEVQNDYLKVQAYKVGTQARLDAEKKLQDDLRKLNDAERDAQKAKDKEKRDGIVGAFQEIDSETRNYSSAAVNVLDIGFDRRKVQLEELEAQQQKNYENEVSNIQASTTTEEEKAARLKVLESQRQAQKEANDRKQREADNQKAQFDKARDILGIITGTALAVVKALPNVPLAVSIGILGASELAAAVATPIPHYKRGAGINGRPLHAGGLAVVGDGGEQELISEPGKKPYLSASTPQLLDLSPKTSVVPISMLDEMSRMWVADGGRLFHQNDNSAVEAKLDRLNNTMVWMTGTLKASARNNRPRVVVVNNIGKDVAHAAWVKKNIFD
jgi:hypothetical protein